MTLLGAALSAAGTEPTCYSLVVNDWICPSYLSDRQSELVDATVEHLWITGISVLIGLVIALPLAVVARRYERLESLVLGGTTIVYTIPSLAMFSLLLPAFGLTARTVIVGLALYSLTILVRNTVAGLKSVPDDVLESATGLGYGSFKMLTRIELPLALPVIMAGLRVATVSTVALTTVGAIVDYGGLGNLLLEGVNTQFKAQILAASVLCVLLAIVLDLILLGAERVMTPWSRARQA